MKHPRLPHPREEIADGRREAVIEALLARPDHEQLVGDPARVAPELLAHADDPQVRDRIRALKPLVDKINALPPGVWA